MTKAYNNLSIFFIRFNYTDHNRSICCHGCGGCRAWPNRLMKKEIGDAGLKINVIGDPVLQRFVGSNPTSRIYILCVYTLLMVMFKLNHCLDEFPVKPIVSR